MTEPLRIIISGGGTGGHIFPAVSIANAIREISPSAEILFVGAEGRMEMQRVPAAGYEIKGLPVAGFDRKHLWRNVSVLIKLMKSRRLARKIVSEFRPQVAVGVGGYASGPTLDVAQKMGIPTLLQEQNSYAGVTNKLLAKKAKRICVAYEGMERFFPAEAIMMTGNPVRQNLLHAHHTREEQLPLWDSTPPNAPFCSSVVRWEHARLTTVCWKTLPHPPAEHIQFVWQTGKYYSQSIAERLAAQRCPENLKVMDFISNMDVAYAAADLVISRAGAGSISEFCLLGKPVILVPSPNVAEDHQTKNAMALVQKDAALFVADAEAPRTLIPLAVNTVNDAAKLASLSENVKKLAMPNAAEVIAREVIKLAEGK